MLEWALNEYSSVANNYSGENKSSHRTNWAHHMLWFASGLAPIMKTPAFEEESEWRTVYLLRSIREIQFVPRATGLVPVLAMKLGQQQSLSPVPNNLIHDTLTNLPDKLPIASLWSGPGASGRISLFSARALLEKNGYGGVKLASSEIPFRVS